MNQAAYEALCGAAATQLERQVNRADHNYYLYTVGHSALHQILSCRSLVDAQDIAQRAVNTMMEAQRKR